MTAERLRELQRRGWRLTRDGSTATARLPHEDPEDPESGWQLLVLHTAGHGARFSVEVDGSGLTERSRAELRGLLEALEETLELLESWQGELPGE